jgi:endonuclease/exonuclease/phosphatase family metal-dependent hydrolase
LPSLATFNANNFFLRYKFTNTYPNDRSRASLIEASEVGAKGYLPGIAFGRYTRNYIVWDPVRRQLAARALKEPDGGLPDILCLQEVENIQAIRIFNQRYLAGYYPYSLLIDAYDPRNIDVGLLSRYPIGDIRSHIDDSDRHGNRIFSRDCLEASIALPGGETLTLFINHLKSKLVIRKKNENDADYHARIRSSHRRREKQAQEAKKLVTERFAGAHSQTLYAVIGDFNDTPQSPYIRELVRSGHLTDLLRAHRPANDRWTYYWRSAGRVSQIDYLLASRKLAQRVDALVAADGSKRPHIERKGLGFKKLNAAGKVLPKTAKLVHFEKDPVTPRPAHAPADERIDFRFDRYGEVMANWKKNISDHCPVKIWF